MGYTIFHADELDWQPRREGDPRLAAGLSDAMTQSRANLFRYPPGSVGRRHIDPIQEEVFVVIDGTLTIHMGEDGAVEEHELAQGSPARARRDDLPRSGLTDGLLGAGLVAGIAVHDRRQHEIEGTTRVGRHRCN